MSQPTQAEVDRVIGAYESAIGAKGYADSLVLEMQEIEEDDYKMVWSEQYPNN